MTKLLPGTLSYLGDDSGSIFCVVMAGELWGHQVATLCMKY